MLIGFTINWNKDHNCYSYSKQDDNSPKSCKGEVREGGGGRERERERERDREREREVN